MERHLAKSCLHQVPRSRGPRRLHLGCRLFEGPPREVDCLVRMCPMRVVLLPVSSEEAHAKVTRLCLFPLLSLFVGRWCADG